MTKLLLIFFALCASNLVYSKLVDFSQFANPCPRNIDDYEECSRQALEKVWPRLLAGVPEVNLPPLDPLKIDEMNGTHQYGAARGTYQATNIAIYGLANAKFLSVNPKVEDERLHFELRIYQPKLFIEMDYIGETDYNGFIVRAKGHSNVSMTDVTTKVVMDGPVVDDRWVLETVNVTPKIGDMKYWASDLFNGNKAFTEAAVAFINSNWRMLYDIGLPMVQDQLNKKVVEFLNNIFAEIPFSKIFPQ